MLNDLQFKRMMPLLGMVTVAALIACGNAAASLVPEPAVSQENLVATAVAEALTAVVPTPKPDPTPNPTPKSIYDDPNFDFNQFAPDPARGIWWEVTREDMQRTKKTIGNRAIWVRPDESRKDHRYFLREHGTDSYTYTEQIRETLQQRAMEFLDGQGMEYDEWSLLGNIRDSLRLEYASSEYPILRVQARFLGDAEKPSEQAYLIGAVVALDWNTLVNRYIPNHGWTLGVEQVIGSVLIEPSFYETR